MNNYMEYIKCGEILISPKINYKEQYILKCSECNEYFSLLDAFLRHSLDHYNEINENHSEIKSNVSDEIDLPDDPLTMQQAYNDLSKVLKVEFHETVAIEDAAIGTTTTQITEDIDRDTAINNWTENSSTDDDFGDDREPTYAEDFLAIDEDSNVKHPSSSLQKQCLEEEKPFVCDECGSRLKTRKSLKRHKRIHLRSEKKEHECWHCKKVFKKSSSLTNHLKSHRDYNEMAASGNDDEEDDSEDGDCDWKSQVLDSSAKVGECKDFSICEESEKPKEEDQGEKQFICGECGSRLKTRKSLKRHLRIHLRQPGEREQAKTTKYECEFCKKVFQQSSSLKDHLRTHTGEQPYLCSECGKAFKSLSNMKQHFLRHGTDRPYECPDCPKKFPCLSDLASHKAVHTKAKSHVCDVCGSGFVKPYLLKKHKMYHTGEKNHKCDYCDMRFVLADQCRRHMRTHTGEKPYKCKYCIRAFAQSNDLIKHLRGHLGDNVYKCNMCPLGFRLQGDLRTHFNTHKNDDEETKLRNLQALKDDELRIQMKFGLVQEDDERH